MTARDCGTGAEREQAARAWMPELISKPVAAEGQLAGGGFVENDSRAPRDRCGCRLVRRAKISGAM